MNIGKNIDGLINGGGAFLSPQEIVSKYKNGGGSGGHLFVNVTWTDGNATMDKSYAEIVAAFRSGIVPVFISDYDDGVDFYHLSFFGVTAEGETPYMIQIVHFGDDDTNLYLFQSATETGTLVYSGGADLI